MLAISIMVSSTLEISAENMVVEPAVPNTVSVKLSFAGDTTLGSDLSRGYCNSFIDVYQKQESSYDYFFKNVKSIFDNDDLTIVNFEGTLTNSNARADKTYAFKGLPEFSNILKSGGIEVANLANNHTKDYGTQGYADTVKNLNKAGVASFGIDKPYITEIKGIKVGLLGYTAWSAEAYMKNKVTHDIADLREQGADIVVTSFHGGVEHDYYPNDVQKKLYRHAVDAGADVVIGHHPHVLQGIEEYNGKYIVYSLGNFSFGGNRNPSDKDTMIFQQTFEFDKDTKEKVDVVSTVIPCSVTSSKSGNNFQPTPLEGQAADRIINKLEGYSKPMNKNSAFIAKMDAGFKTSTFVVADSTSVVFEGNAVSFDTPILNKDNVSYVAIKPLAEQMNGSVDWNPETNSITASIQDKGATIKVGESGTFIYEGRTYMPVKQAAELFGYYTVWNDQEQRVYIY